MPRRYYSSTAFVATLTADINNTVTSFAVSTVTGWPSSFPYTIIVDENTANEELMEVTSRSGTTLTVTRGVDGTTAVSHLSGASVKHGVSARDFNEPNAFLNTGGTVTGPVAITESGSAAALRVTNTGTGASLLIEDEASTDSTPFVVTSTGRVGVGLTSPGSNVHVLGEAAGTGYRLDHYTSNPGSGTIFLTKFRGTAASPTVVNSGDGLGGISFQGWGGSALHEGVRIDATVDATPGASDMPGRLTFSTTPDGSLSPTERMRIDSAGRVAIGYTTPGNVQANLTVSGQRLQSATASAVSFTAGSKVMDVVTHGSGTWAVGQYVEALATSSFLPPGTRIVSLGTGTGGTGTYNLSAASSTTTTGQTMYGRPYESVPFIRLHAADSAPSSGSLLGGVQFWSDDISTDANEIRASIGAETTGSTGATRLVFTTASATSTHAVRMLLDGAGLLSAPAGTSLGPWTSYTPTLAGTGWAIGNGTITGRYCQIGKTVHYRVAITFGSTSTYGTLSPTVTIPVTAENTAITNFLSGTHNAHCEDNSTGNIYVLSAHHTGVSSQIQLKLIGTNGLTGTVNSTTPFTWAAPDTIRLSGTYEAA